MLLKRSLYFVHLVLICGLALVAQDRTEQATQHDLRIADPSNSSAYDPGEAVTPPVLVENKDKDRSFDELSSTKVRHKGFVNLLVLVGESGRVDAVSVQKSWASPDLDARAVAAATPLEFRPGTMNGVAVRTRVGLGVAFWEYRSQIIMEPITTASVSPHAVEGVGLVYGVGNGVTAPKPRKSPDPEYSKEARKKRHEGTSTLWVIVDGNGQPRTIGVKRPAGYGLDEKAIEAVKKWSFAPAMKDGKPVPVLINVEVTFRLQ